MSKTRPCPRCGTRTQTFTVECQSCERVTWVEEVEHLISNGAGWGTIASQLGMAPATIEKRLHRFGRPDLADCWRTLCPQVAA